MPRQGWSPEEVGPPAVGEAVGGEASGGNGTAPSLEGRSGWKAPVGVGVGPLEAGLGCGGRVQDEGGRVGAVLFTGWAWLDLV